MEFPLLRRQLMKLMVPTEAALSVFMFTGHAMARANSGDANAQALVRMLTPLLKFRACRDNVPVATGAMEIRGGNGYIEDWVNARLIRDAQVGLLWEGTSNINALDVTTRAIGRVGAHQALLSALEDKVADATALPSQFRGALSAQLKRAFDFAESVAADPESEDQARVATNALYYATAAALLAWEGVRSGMQGKDARRLLLSRMVLEHRLAPRDPLVNGDSSYDRKAAAALLSDEPIGLDEAAELLLI